MNGRGRLLGGMRAPYALEDNRLSLVIDRAGVTQNRRKDVAYAPLTCANTLVSKEAPEIGGRLMPTKRQRFAARRKAAGFSQEQLAERLSVDRSTVAAGKAVRLSHSPGYVHGSPAPSSSRSNSSIICSPEAT